MLYHNINDSDTISGGSGWNDFQWDSFNWNVYDVMTGRY